MFRMITLLVLLSPLLLPSTACAQEKPTGKDPAAKEKRGWGEEPGKGKPKAGEKESPSKKKTKADKVIKRLKKTRNQLLKDRLLASNVLVEVALRNRQKITGIVRNRRFAEKRILEKGIQQGTYVPAKPTDQGAGLRLYYYNNTSSVMFISYTQIAQIRKKNNLTDLEVQRHAKEIKDKEEAQLLKSRKMAKERIAKIKARQESKKKVENNLKKALDKLKKQQEETEQRIRWTKLLDEFPPDKGWGAERIKRIQQNKINGIYPTKKEARFLEVFSEWTKAVAQSGTPAEKPEPTKKGK